MRNIREVFINGVSLEEILDKHEKWLNGEEDGEKADLNGVDLSYVDLSYVVLRGADLRGSNLKGAYLRRSDLRNSDLKDTNLKYAYLKDIDLSYANLMGANLSYTNLKDANLKDTNLRDADLRGANLRDADLCGADLRLVDLSYADLSYANLTNTNLGGSNLTNANLYNADLKNINYNTSTSFFALQCPEKGSFIGYKIAREKIVELLITEDAKRSSATSRKCRCSKAKVLSITNVENTEEYNEVASVRDKSFVYRVGEIVEVKDFDENRWNECSAGIHFFMTRDEAVKYQI